MEEGGMEKEKNLMVWMNRYLKVNILMERKGKIKSKVA